ncbi:MAG: hypothetical protein ABFD64_02915 [Armatimonadota bacterium]
MAVVKELIDKYESGRGTIKGKTHTSKRVLLVDKYPGLTETGVPAYRDPHPIDPSLLVTQIDYEGYGGLDETLEGPFKYRMSKITVTYSTDTSGDTTMSRKEMEGQVLDIGGFGAFLTSGNTVERPRNIPIGIWKIIVPRRVLVEPTATIASLWNKVNDNGFGLEGYTFPAETVLFEGASSRRVWDSEEQAIMYEIEYCFKVNFFGWNCGYDGAAGVWDIILPRQFAVADFSGFPG